MRVVNVVEKNIRPNGAALVNVPAGKSTELLPDISTQNYMAVEVAARYIQNLSGTDAYYAFGETCDGSANPPAAHGLIQNKQQLDCSNHGASVSVWSAAGGNFAVTELRRKDLSEHVTTIPGRNA